MAFAFARFALLFLAMAQCLRISHKRLVLSYSSLLLKPSNKKEDIDVKQREFWSKQQDLVASEISLKGKRLDDLEKTAEAMLFEKSQQKVSLSDQQKEQESNEDTEQTSRETAEELSDSTSKNSKKAPPTNRLIDLESIELAGRWEQREGNFVLRPRSKTEEAVGVIHFIGGAFVGAAPHLTYRYLLETLCDAGYIIVATPYKLDFDYVKCADEILDRFDRVAVQLAREVGPLPVVGVGHSAGALLQTLITCLFPGAPRAGNVLVSFNNKEVREAIPAFDELVVPVTDSILDDAPQSVQFRNAVGNFRAILDSTVDTIASSVLVPGFVENEAVPVLRQGLEILYQIPFVLRTIHSGTRDFIPSPDETKEVCRRMYRARSTLLLKFKDDSLDESSDIEKVLREANTIMRMKRPMVEMDLMLKELEGTHLTPLTQAIFDPPDVIIRNIPDSLLSSPIRKHMRDIFLYQVDDLSKEILSWLNTKIKR